MNEFSKSLRALADWYDAHPDMPAPFHAMLNVFPHADQLKTVVHNCGGFAKNYYDDRFIALSREFGDANPIQLDINWERAKVCTRRVVGQRGVPEQVIPAHTEDIVEWDCHPLLEGSP